MLDILCFGNSLTQGFWHYGLEEPHPYALALKETLVEEEIVEGEIEIDVEGKPGDLVNCPPGQFIDRMRRRCTSPFPFLLWILV
jgi:hypothetical protein